MNKKSVAVRIAGHEYKILTEGDGDSLRQIAADVDRAMKRVRDRTGTVDTLDIAVLTCLNLAREIIELRNQSNASASDERIRDLIGRVEALLPDHARTATSSAAAELSQPDDQNSQQEPLRKTARTLDLSSFEAAREQANSAQGAKVESRGDELPRAAAGGRERAS